MCIGAFSAALCRGLIEATSAMRLKFGCRAGFPRLYVAASLKRRPLRTATHDSEPFSAALCRGLIEADWRVRSVATARSFPRLYVAASLKRADPIGARHDRIDVFRGFMSRPH